MSKPNLTAEQKEKYIRNDSFCPFCESDDLDSGRMETDSHGAWRDVSCNDCERSWQDQYTLTNVQSYGDDGHLQDDPKRAEREVGVAYQVHGGINQCLVFTDSDFQDKPVDEIQAMLNDGTLLTTCQDGRPVFLMPGMKQVGYVEGTEPQLESEDFECEDGE